MNLHKMIEICLKDDNMHISVMINALICINNYVITCMNSMLSWTTDRSNQHVLDWASYNGPDVGDVAQRGTTDQTGD